MIFLKKIIKHSDSVNRLKVKLISSISLFFILILSLVFVLLGVSVSNFAQAISSNYSKPLVGGQLDVGEWNNLPADFVARSGGAASSMSGPLDMGGRNINNLAAPVGGNDAATRQYVDTSVAGAGSGGDNFVNWGRGDCPVGTTQLYSGYAFGTKWDEPNGSGDVMCIQSGDAGPAATSPRDKLWPAATGQAGFIPAGLPESKEIKCALCLKPSKSCYNSYGSNSCATGFTAAYSGYVMGGTVNVSGSGVNKNERYCINSNFDSTTNSATWGSVFYGTEIYSNSDLPAYTAGAYIKCSVCCN